MKKAFTKKVGPVVGALEDTIKKVQNGSTVEAEKLIGVLGNAIEIIVAFSNSAALNSSNSSKPPSTDNGKPKKTRKAPGKKRNPGGQPGHNGSRLNPVENPTQIEKIQIDLESLPPGEYTPAGVEKRQVFDIEISCVVTEYQAEILRDQDGVHYMADFPAGVTEPAQYGASVKAHSVYMSQYQLIPLKRAEEHFHDQLGIALSKGSVSNWNAQAFDLLAPFEEWARLQLLNSPCNSADETGINLNGKTFWLHSLSCGTAVLFHADEKRGQEAMDRMGILPLYQGVVVHDHWKPYFGYSCIHALCNAHHLRELQAAIELEDQAWAEKMQSLLLEMRQSVEKAGGFLTPAEVEFLKIRYRAILSDAQRECPKNEKTRRQSKSRNLLQRLIDYEAQTLLFLENPNVPFTNNRAENDIRMTKVQQKISGCFRSEDGARQFCRIRSYLLTCHRHDMTSSEALNLVFNRQLPAFISDS